MGGIAIINHHKLRIGLTGLFLIYIFTVLWVTVLNRSIGYHEMEYELFWSYKKWFAGDTVLGREIMANIAMFIPYGFLMSALLPFRCSRKVRITVVISTAMIFSLLIEVLQLFLMRGLFEWDDLASNTAGASIGVAVYALLEKLLKEKQLSFIVLTSSTVFAVICLGVSIRYRDTIGLEADTTFPLISTASTISGYGWQCVSEKNCDSC